MITYNESFPHKTINDLGLKIWDYVIYWGWPLWVRGLRETDDIDICVSIDARKRLLEKWNTIVITKFNNESIVIGDLEIACTILWLSPMETESAIARPDIIYGCAFLTLDLNKKAKLSLGRPKDMRDIELIEEYEQLSIDTK
jgi:hypothetical protein